MSFYDAMKKLALLASKLDEKGYHFLADHVDDSMGMVKQAYWNEPSRSYEEPDEDLEKFIAAFEKLITEPPQEQTPIDREGLLREKFKVHYYDILMRALAYRKIFGDKGLSNDIVERWLQILSYPENVEEIKKWLQTGDFELLKRKEEGTPNSWLVDKALSMPGAWAIEDKLMPFLEIVLGENDLSHFSEIDKDRLFSGNLNRKFDADFSNADNSNLYEMKEIRGQDDNMILRGRSIPTRSVLPQGLQGFDYILNNIRNISQNKFQTHPSPVDVSIHKVPLSDILDRNQGISEVPGRNVLIPNNLGEVLRTTLQPDEMQRFIEKQHGGNNGPWEATWKRWRDKLER